MKKLVITSIFGLALAIAFGFGFIPTTEQKAYCADCETSNLTGIRNIFTEFAKECGKKVSGGDKDTSQCLHPQIYKAILITMKALGTDNRFGPGDRILFVGESQVGNLLAGANRGFQTIAPLDQDSLKVEVNKRDGKNGALVKICTVDENGTQKRVGTINFAEDSNETGIKSATVTGVQGKVVRIDVASFGSAVRKFEYTLKTSQ